MVTLTVKSSMLGENMAPSKENNAPEKTAGPSGAEAGMSTMCVMLFVMLDSSGVLSVVHHRAFLSQLSELARNVPGPR